MGRKIGLVAAAILIIGAFLPWGSNMAGTVRGIDGDGIITIGIAVIVIILLLIKKVPVWIALILGVVASIIAVIDYDGIASVNSDLGLDLEPGLEATKIKLGAGLYLTVAGAFGLVIGPVIALFEGKKKS